MAGEEPEKTFVQGLSFELRINICANYPPHRQPAKSYMQPIPKFIVALNF